MNLSINAQVSRIEPPNWWAGMKRQELQIMFYGKNLKTSAINTDYPGVSLIRVTEAENPNYIFIDLRLDPDLKPGIMKIQVSKNGSSQYIDYEFKKREPGSAERVGFNSSDVIYLVVPDRFANGDTTNDISKDMYEASNRNKNSGRHGGDIRGISDHVNYLQEMGYTALWLTPVLENNQKRTSYHGYAITDFYKVDPRMGSNEDYAKLSKKLKSSGIKLIMDMVFNHCGSEHWWMSDLPFADWINFYPEFKLTNHRRTVNQDPYASQADKNLMSKGWFVPSMPDLNQNNPFLAEYLIQNSIWWIESANLGGIRVDTYPYPEKEFMGEWTKRVLAEYPEFTMVGEEWSENAAIVSYWQRGKNNKDGYVSMLPSLMDFPLQSSLVKALNEEEGWGTGWIRLYEALAQDFLYPDPYNLVIIADNHDMARFYMQVNKDYELFRLGMTFLLTTRGIPQIFYGTEILLTHPKNNDHGDIRKDFPGGWVNDSSNAFTGEGLRAKQLEAQVFLKNLIHLRNGNEVFQTGKLLHFTPQDGCYVYFRYNNYQKFMLVLNKNINPVRLSTDKYQEIISGATYARDALTGNQFTLTDTLTIPQRSALVLELK